MKHLKLIALAFSLFLVAVSNQAAGLGTAFTYQGRLTDGGNPANGFYDLRSTIYDSQIGGNPVANAITNSAVAVSNGLFNTELDFGASVFIGEARWLEIGVRTNGSTNAFTLLAPRHPLRPAPFALYAPTAGTASAATTVVSGGVVNASLAPDSITSEKITDATIDASDLNPTLVSNTFWRLTGNSGTAPGTHFLGTTDNQPLEFRVNNERVMQWSYASNTVNGSSPNVIAGFAGNFFSNGVVGAAIVGGGHSGLNGTNSVLADFGAVLGGRGNTASGTYSTATGYSTTANGRASTAMNEGTEAKGDSSTAMGYGTVAGGNAAVAMGSQSIASGGASTALGQSTTANNFASTAMGSYTTASGVYSTAMGDTTIASGYVSIAMGAYSKASGEYSTAIGYSCTATNLFSFAAGYRANANHQGAFVWSDNSGPDFLSSAVNEFAVRATGGIRFVSGLDTNGVPVAGVSLPAGSGSWTSLSDRNAKTDFALVDPREVLERLAEIPIQSWRYKTEAASVRHVGPVAQDFTAAFNLGADDKHIATVDADGVALAAIQGLNQKLEAKLGEQQAELKTKDERIAALEASLTELKEAVSRLLADRK